MTPESAPTLETLDKERVLHPATSIADHLKTGPRIMTEGSGITLTDTAGRRYLDAVAGLWCVNIGYGRTEVADAMGAQARRLAYYHTFSSMSNEPQIRLADRLLAADAGPDEQGVLRQLRLGRQRHPGEARLVLPQPQGPAAEEEDRLPLGGLPRHHRRLGQPHGAAGVPPGLRPPDRERRPHEAGVPLPRRARPGSPRRTTPPRWRPSWRRSSSGKGPTPSPRSSPSRSWAPAACWSRPGRTSRRCRPCSGSTTS